MDTKGGKPQWGGDGGVMNWETGIDMYTLMCIKLMTNKNLLYKKNPPKQKKPHQSLAAALRPAGVGTMHVKTAFAVMFLDPGMSFCFSGAQNFSLFYLE